MKRLMSLALLAAAVVLLVARIQSRIQENAKEDASVYEYLDDAETKKQNQELWAQDEQRRIDSLNSRTFTDDGQWLYADPDYDAHYREQMRQLGWMPAD